MNRRRTLRRGCRLLQAHKSTADLATPCIAMTTTVLVYYRALHADTIGATSNVNSSEKIAHKRHGQLVDH